ncbi:MAG: hypothetical protein E7559_02490 [Ruminococcaceae bacterium]|nr:hypothetical protein [Oscillospiraceae bacterium]
MKISTRSRISSLLVGLLFLAACAGFVAAMVFDKSFLPDLITRSWPALLLLALGLIGMIKRGGRLFSFGMMLVGGGLLIRSQGWFDGILDNVAVWHMIVAALLFIIGIGSIGHALGLNRTHCAPYIEDENGNHIIIDKGIHVDAEDGEVSSIFSEQVVSYDGQVFTGGGFNAIFGSLVVDLSGAVIENNCTIDANGIFGKLIIKRVANVNYAVERSAIFGSVNCSPAAPIEGAPTVTVEANGIFGSVEII